MTPMMHASGIYVLLGSMRLGQACVLLPLFDPAAALDAVEKYFSCALTLALPALMQFVLEEQVKRPRDVSSLKLVFAGGDTVPVALQGSRPRAAGRRNTGRSRPDGDRSFDLQSTGGRQSGFTRESRQGSRGAPGRLRWRRCGRR